MGGDFGSIQAMRDALRANKALLGERIKYFDRGSDFTDIKRAYRKASKDKSRDKQLSREELAAIRNRVIEIRKKEFRVKLVMFISFSLLIICGIYLTFDFSAPVSTTETLVHRKEKIKTRERFLYCVEDGDMWLKKNGWHNAIFQYEEALRLNPGNPAVKKRLAIAYTYRCRNVQIDCDKAKSSIQELIDAEPNNPKHKELLASYLFGIKDSTSARVALDEATWQIR